ncbi:MAG TPA: hypothetical protein PKA13_24450 [Geminicoccaceae bacterium]|nr:hypothetical protein [Geminicoccus sp.]HMU52948.1 hypothetical protein [Geminicoccaceae bacterium]
MPSLVLSAETAASARATGSWSVPRAAAFVTLASGMLWLAIFAAAGWLIG